MSQSWGKIGVLMGGYSSEREISLKSGKAVYQALKDEGCDVIALDILERGERSIIEAVQAAQINIAFLTLHGQLGEDGTIQTILDKMDIPYTGSSAHASRQAFDKVVAQDIFKRAGLPVPLGINIHKDTQGKDLKQAIAGIKEWPVIVKPACEGSSIGISMVEKKEDLLSALEAAWKYGDEILVEQFIKGEDVTVGILGEEALPVVEIRPKKTFFDFNSKYTQGGSEYLCPAPLPDAVTTLLQTLALKAHRMLGCEDLSRVDFRLDENHQPFILEVNTLPGFTSTSLLPMAAKEKGISFSKLCLNILGLTYAKKERQQKISSRR